MPRQEDKTFLAKRRQMRSDQRLATYGSHDHCVAAGVSGSDSEKNGKGSHRFKHRQTKPGQRQQRA